MDDIEYNGFIIQPLRSGEFIAWPSPVVLGLPLYKVFKTLEKAKETIDFTNKMADFIALSSLIEKPVAKEKDDPKLTSMFGLDKLNNPNGGEDA